MRRLHRSFLFGRRDVVMHLQLSSHRPYRVSINNQSLLLLSFRYVAFLFDVIPRGTSSCSMWKKTIVSMLSTAVVTLRGVFSLDACLLLMDLLQVSFGHVLRSSRLGHSYLFCSGLLKSILVLLMLCFSLAKWK